MLSAGSSSLCSVTSPTLLLPAAKAFDWRLWTLFLSMQLGALQLLVVLPAAWAPTLALITLGSWGLIVRASPFFPQFQAQVALKVASLPASLPVTPPPQPSQVRGELWQPLWPLIAKETREPNSVPPVLPSTWHKHSDSELASPHWESLEAVLPVSQTTRTETPIFDLNLRILLAPFWVVGLKNLLGTDISQPASPTFVFPPHSFSDWPSFRLFCIITWVVPTALHAHVINWFLVLSSLSWEQASGFSLGVVKCQESIILKEEKIKESLRFAKRHPLLHLIGLTCCSLISLNWVWSSNTSFFLSKSEVPEAKYTSTKWNELAKGRWKDR